MTTYSGTRAWEGRAASPPRDRGCARSPASGCPRARPWRTRRPHRSSGPRRRCRCRATRTRDPACHAHGWSRAGRRTGTPAAGTCTGTSCRSAWASSPGRTSTPSRPRRGCPRRWSDRTSALSGSGPRRSTARATDTAAGARHTHRRSHPPPSGTRASAHGRAESNPTRRRRCCSPHGRCPTDARTGTAPTPSTQLSRSAHPRAGHARRSFARRSWARPYGHPRRHASSGRDYGHILITRCACRGP